MRDVHEFTESILSSDERAHAYIIEGKAGDTRDDFVKTIVKDLTGDIASPDAVYMQKSGKNSYKVQDAGAFSERLGMRPYGRALVGVIDDAESMSEIIQNKLLKTLEEPGEDVIMLLVTSRADELIATVKSRCTVVRMQEFSGFTDEQEEDADGEFMEGVLMLLTQRHAFYEFREFIDKHIKTDEDALKLISFAEDRLRSVMASGRAGGLCADRIEKAEKAAEQIVKGMDRAKIVKKLFLDFADINTYET